MDFDLSDEQVMLKDSALRLGREHYQFNDWRARAAVGRGIERADWSRMAELGWLGLNVPEAYGGLGGAPVETMVLMEAFGRFLMLEPYVSTCVIAPALLRHATFARRADLMQRIAEGAVVISLADAEPASRFDLGWVATRASAGPGGFELTGEKSHCLDGAAADWFLIPARTQGADGDADGISLFLVAADAPGLVIAPMRAMDNRQNARLRLEGVRVDADALIGEAGKALPLLQDAVDRGIAARLAEALGAMEAVNEMTLQYLKTRQQFGQPIGAFQVLQHRAVDMAIACEEARSMTYLATLSLDQPAAERTRIVSAAKARVSQTSLYVGRQAVQLHGGVGFSDELVVGHYLKRLIMIDMAFGNADHHRGRFAEMSDLIAA
jgi:alkylation response protein AidB-like acyl-CoA dehydrogenase